MSAAATSWASSTKRSAWSPRKFHLPEGVHIEWSGEFEHQVRAARTLRFVFPAVIVLIFVILYLTYNDLADAALMMLAVPEALAGGAFFMYLFPKIMQRLGCAADGFQRGRVGRLHRLLRHGDRDRASSCWSICARRSRSAAAWKTSSRWKNCARRSSKGPSTACGPSC